MYFASIIIIIIVLKRHPVSDSLTLDVYYVTETGRRCMPVRPKNAEDEAVWEDLWSLTPDLVLFQLPEAPQGKQVGHVSPP